MPRSRASCRLSLAVHLLHADAGDRRQPRADVLRLGRRRPLLLPADRVLVRPARANAAAIKAFVVNRIGDFGFAVGISPSISCSARSISGRCSAPRRGWRARPCVCPRHASRRADGDLHPAVHRRDGQVGADRAAHLVARRDGGPDPGFGLDPCRDDGDGRRVPGGADVADVRIFADRAQFRDGGRRHHGAVRGDDRRDADRHQARHRLFDLLAARLHVLRRRRLGLSGVDVPPDHACLLQGAAVPRRRLGDPCHVGRAGHAQDGRARAPHPYHLRGDVDRQPGACRHSAVRRLLLQGRDPGGRLCLRHGGGAVRLRPRHLRRVPDRVLFLAPAVPDLPRPQSRRPRHAAPRA